MEKGISIIKSVVRVGNSAGVVLPLSWYGGEARIELIKKPLLVKEDILNIAQPYLDSILGIYLVGSYARREENEISDVDALVITSDINKRIKKGKYDVLLISLDEVKKAMKIIVPIIPMIHEAVPIINKQLLEDLKKEGVKKENLKWHIETTKSMLNLIKKDLEIGRELNEKEIGAGIVYSLILRLRQVYIIDCLLKDEDYKNKDFIKLLRKNNIYELYDLYRKEKVGKSKIKVSAGIVEKAYKLLRRSFEKQVERLKK